MTMASGTWGTIQWSISDDGALTLGAGVQPQTPIFNTKEAYPWHGYRQSITSVRFTGSISSRRAYIGTADSTAWSSAFSDCQALTSVSGLSYISNAVNTTSMFFGCSSLTSIDLSSFDTSKLEYIGFMFMNCTVLTSIKFGAYGFGSLDVSYSDRLYLIDSNYKTAECNGIVVSSDKQFLALEKTEQAGTWTRNATASSVSCTAQRTASGTAREDGDDVTFSFTWAFAQGSTSAPVRIYQKPAGDSSYPSSPTATLTLSGNAGNTTYTIAGIGDAAYDYRVEIVDGSSTYVFFPAVTANIRLMDFDKNGNAHVYGGLTTDGDVTDGAGNVLSDKLDTTDAASTYLPLAGGVITGGLSVTGAQIVQSWAGVIQMFAGSTPPAGWLLCDGSAVSRTTYATLYAAIGDTWGAGNGSTTFNLPDLRGRTVVGVDSNGSADSYAESSNMLLTDTAGIAQEAYLAYKLKTTGRTLEANTRYTLQLFDVHVCHSGKTETTIGLGVYWGAGGSVNELSGLVAANPNNDGETTLKSYTSNGNVYAYCKHLTITLDTTGKTQGDNLLWIYNSPAEASGKRFVEIGRWMLTKESDGALPWEPRRYFHRYSAYDLGMSGGIDHPDFRTEHMPSHTHGKGSLSITASGSHSHKVKGYGDYVAKGSNYYRYGSSGKETASIGMTSETHTHPNANFSGNTGPAGDSHSFDVRQPYVAVNYIIHTGKVS